MKGTEKQIRWAEDIQKKVIDTINWLIDNAPAEQKDACAKKFGGWADQVKNTEYAGDIIDAFGYIRFTDDQRKNAQNVAAAIRLSPKYKY